MSTWSTLSARALDVDQHPESWMISGVFAADAVARVSSGNCCASYAGAREAIGDDVSAPEGVFDLIANGRAGCSV